MNDMTASINAARAAAANIVDDAEVLEETLPAVQGQAEIVLNRAKPSMATKGGFKGLGGLVGGFLKVDEFGLSIDTDRKKLESIKVSIDMTEDKGFWVKDQIKWGNSPVNYASRYDGVLADNGLPWAEVVARAMRVDPKAKVFDSADIILTVLEPIPQGTKDKPAESIAVGTKLGLGLSMSNWRNWEDFYGTVSEARLIGSAVEVELSAQEVVGKKNGLTWGVVGFKLLSAAA